MALPYWPEEVDSMEIGPFTLKKVNTTTTEYIKMTDIELTTADSNVRTRHTRCVYVVCLLHANIYVRGTAGLLCVESSRSCSNDMNVRLNKIMETDVA